jgi:hypothetical protein
MGHLRLVGPQSAWFHAHVLSLSLQQSQVALVLLVAHPGHHLLLAKIPSLVSDVSSAASAQSSLLPSSPALTAPTPFEQCHPLEVQ